MDLIKVIDHTICIGHVPTIFLPDIQRPVITALSGNKVILTDCGTGYGERLGCIRLEDEAVFYMEIL